MTALGNQPKAFALDLGDDQSCYLVFVMSSKTDVPSTAVGRRSNKISIIRLKTQAANTSTTTNYANVAYTPLAYNMAMASLADYWE